MELGKLATDAGMRAVVLKTLPNMGNPMTSLKPIVEQLKPYAEASPI